MKKRDLARRVARYSQTADKLNWIARWEAMVEPRTAPMLGDRYELYRFLKEHIGDDAITYLEFGVASGDSIRAWAGLDDHTTSTFHGFDTFEGLPESWSSSFPEGSFSTGGVPPQIDDPRVQFSKGLFQDTLRAHLAALELGESRLVVHMDADLYSATLYALTQLDHLMPAGTIVLFDEFQSYLHEFRAWYDYQSAYGRAFTFLAFASGGVNAAVELS